MAKKRTPLVTDEYYHVFNRGVARNPIFFSKADYAQAMLALSFYRYNDLPMRLSRFKKLTVDERRLLLDKIQENKKLVEIISFVFMPNHFHFLLRQCTENGIATFISNFSNSYTRYINTKYDRVGPLLQGAFKSVHVESDEQLFHLSRYIHLNPVTSSIIRSSDLFVYPWSSLPSYLNNQTSLCNVTPVLSQFPSVKSYTSFLIDQIEYAKELHNLKHLALDEH